jgi:hypothetical protein
MLAPVLVGVGVFASMAVFLGLWIWALMRVVERARAAGRSVAGAVIGSVLVTPFVMLLVVGRRQS